jgi:hypothetical protein
MDISEMKLGKGIFEFKYNQSLLLWDRAGTVWTEMKMEWPKLEARNIEPSRGAFVEEGKKEFHVELDKSHVVMLYPQNTLRDFIDIVKLFLPLISKQLEINEFTRLGLRLIYKKEFTSIDDAIDVLLKGKVLSLPTGKQFGIDGQFKHPEYAIRYEGKTQGVIIRVKSESIKYEFNPPFGMPFEALKDEKHFNTFDIDFYSTAIITRGQLNIEEWINQALHMIKRDYKPYLEINR